MFECYNKIIGFSNFDCPCQANGRPADYDESKSGLYLDDLANISALMGADCDKDMWTMLSRAYERGVATLVKDSNALLVKSFKLRRDPIQQQIIGEIKAKDTYIPTGNYGVIRLACNPIRGGYFTIKNIGTIFEAVGATTVALYNNVDGFLENFPLLTDLNKFKNNSIAKEYPLFSKYTECLEYYLVYQFDENNKPKDNKVNCGCGNNPFNFNLNKPYYLSSYKAAPWSNFMLIGSNVINSLLDLDDMPTVALNKMLGLVLDLDFACNVSEVLCQDALDFKGNPLALSLAFAVQYAVGIEVANFVIKNPRLLPQVFTDRDVWEESIAEWQVKYNEHLLYITSKAQITANDCLTCRDFTGMFRRGLFS